MKAVPAYGGWCPPPRTLFAIKTLHGGIEIEDPGRAEKRLRSLCEMSIQPGTTGRFVHADQSATGGVFGDEACDTQESRMHTVFANTGDMRIAVMAGLDRQQESGEDRAYRERYYCDRQEGNPSPKHQTIH